MTADVPCAWVSAAAWRAAASKSGVSPVGWRGHSAPALPRCSHLPLAGVCIAPALRNDSINARFLHCNSFDFRPQFKLYINTNYLPSVDDMSLFSSNRVRVIPFDRHFEPQEQDPNLKHLFAKEESKSAILNRLIAGWQLLQKEGLNSPAAVVEATKEYSRDSNKIALFAEEKLIEDRTGEARTAAVYERYKEWCDVNGCMPENSTNFKKSLQAIGTVVRRRPRDGSEKTTLLLGYRLR